MHYGEGDYVPCEISGQPMEEIHHIVPKGQGGADTLANMIAIKHEYHTSGDRETKFDFLREHLNSMMKRAEQILLTSIFPEKEDLSELNEAIELVRTVLTTGNLNLLKKSQR